MDLNHVVAAEVVLSPHALQEPAPTEDDPRARSQGGEQLELQRGEGHLFPQKAHLAPGEVYGQPSETQRRVFFHGTFTMDRRDGPGLVFIGAGVGITPLISMLRTMADRRGTRPCWLFFDNREWEGFAFREEIEDLKGRLNLKVAHVLSRPPEGWEGEEGRVGAAVLARHLPERYGRLQHFIRGPDPMMDAAEEALSRLGVPGRRVHSERFAMV